MLNGLLKILQQSGVGCHVGGHYVGGLAYADDLTLLCPTVEGLRKMIAICEKYANDFNILFNGAKSQLLLFKGRHCKSIMNDIYVNGIRVEFSDNAIHLGHHISSSDKDLGIKKGLANFWKYFNLFMSNFGHIDCELKLELFQQYCCCFYGAPLWQLDGASMNALCAGWRKSLRCMWRLSPLTHCHIIEGLSGFVPLNVQISHRFMKFLSRNMQAKNALVKSVTMYAIKNPMSITGCNFRKLDYKYEDIVNNPNSIVHESQRLLLQTRDIISVLHDMIAIRDGIAHCDVLTQDDINDIIHTICVL